MEVRMGGIYYAQNALLIKLEFPNLLVAILKNLHLPATVYSLYRESFPCLESLMTFLIH